MPRYQFPVNNWLIINGYNTINFIINKWEDSFLVAINEWILENRRFCFIIVIIKWKKQ